MKTNIAFVGLLLIFFSSCKSPSYLPSSNNIDVNSYGSYIKLIHKKTYIIDGELISIDNDKIIVLTEETKKCTTVKINEVKHFKLFYAQPKHYGWTIPVLLVYPFIHGLLSIITIPVHLLVTISVTVSGENAFKYSDKNMTYDKLRMFARFPQGVPPQVGLESIK